MGLFNKSEEAKEAKEELRRIQVARDTRHYLGCQCYACKPVKPKR